MIELNTLIGDLHLGRSRVSQAEAAYNAALAINPNVVRALRGLGEVLFRQGRYSEAAARFEAATRADARDLEANIGMVKTLVALERIADAKTKAVELLEAHPKSFIVLFWQGKLQIQQGDKKGAEASMVAAIENGKDDPRQLDAFIALATLMSQRGALDEAQAVLTRARDTAGDTPRIHRELGKLALNQGRYEDAKKEFGIALGQDPKDLEAQFRLGVAHRRNREFKEAQVAFDAVAAVDKEFPDLPLEQGNLVPGPDSLSGP